ncbi:hypothetical protein O7A70_12660 [Mesorhizobium sp. Cs1299R1N1]|uniref:hypothetical protein n=1 Tax=Mesorhizobium sp. Cs1299R1N1 TaxID=3015172 RepID=UPI00301CC317
MKHRALLKRLNSVAVEITRIYGRDILARLHTSQRSVLDDYRQQWRKFVRSFNDEPAGLYAAMLQGEGPELRRDIHDILYGDEFAICESDTLEEMQRKWERCRDAGR